jgi:mycothiol system anti-sigma-R factor
MSGHEMLPCREALERLWEYIDGELEGVPHDQVEEHFRVCARCYPHLQFEDAFRRRVHAALSRPHVPPDLRERVLSVLAEAE